MSPDLHFRTHIPSQKRCEGFRRPKNGGSTFGHRRLIVRRPGRQTQLVMVVAFLLLFGVISEQQHIHRDMAVSDAAPQRETSLLSGLHSLLRRNASVSCSMSISHGGPMYNPFLASASQSSHPLPDS